MKTNLNPVYTLLWTILFMCIVSGIQGCTQMSDIEQKYDTKYYNQKNELEQKYSDYGWYKEKYQELTEKTRGNYTITYNECIETEEGITRLGITRTVQCNNSLQPTFDSEHQQLNVVGCATVTNVCGMNFTKK